MKTKLITFETSLYNAALTDLSPEEQNTTIGGDWAEAIGYSIGYAVGTFFVAGPRIIIQSLTIAKYAF